MAGFNPAPSPSPGTGGGGSGLGVMFSWLLPGTPGDGDVIADRRMLPYVHNIRALQVITASGSGATGADLELSIDLLDIPANVFLLTVPDGEESVAITLDDNDLWVGQPTYDYSLTVTTAAAASDIWVAVLGAITLDGG